MCIKYLKIFTISKWILDIRSLWPNGGFQYLLLFDLNDMPHPLCGTPVSGFNPRCSTVDWDKISQYLDFADLSLNREKLCRHKFVIANSVACPESFSLKLHVYVFFLHVRQIQYFLNMLDKLNWNLKNPWRIPIP